MPRTPLLVALLSASVLVPLSAWAQSPGPSYAPMELTADDLGAWDVEMTARSPFGKMTVRGVETNTIGCDGRCIVTKASGQLKSVTSRGGGSSSPWWTSLDGPSGGGMTLKQTGQFETPVAQTNQVALEPVGLPTRFPTSRTVQATNGSRTMRISAEYPDANRRIVTTFTIAPDGQEAQAARIVYTRRR
jgi:hypothetical protein